MEEIFKQRKVELEIAAKNTIVEIHLIKMQADETSKVLGVREKQLEAIDASIRELDHINKLVTAEQDKKEAQALKEKASDQVKPLVVKPGGKEDGTIDVRKRGQ